MTTYTTIPNSSLEPGKPIRSIDGLALRDNPIAITEGAAGAPQIQTAALTAGERMNTTNVLASTAGASVGAVGTYALMNAQIGSTATYAPGSTISGSSLRYVGVSPTNAVASGSIPSGTWRVMGFFYYATGCCGTTDGRSTLCLRIS